MNGKETKVVIGNEEETRGTQLYTFNPQGLPGRDQDIHCRHVVTILSLRAPHRV